MCARTGRRKKVKKESAETGCFINAQKQVGGEKKEKNERQKKDRGITFSKFGSAFSDGSICNAGSSRTYFMGGS